MRPKPKYCELQALEITKFGVDSNMPDACMENPYIYVDGGYWLCVACAKAISLLEEQGIRKAK